MIADRFGALLQELGEALHVTLSPSARNACHVTFPNGLSVWMEPDVHEESVHVIIEIGSPVEGRYRENLFREALRANGLLTNRLGTFCYGAKRGTLLLSETLPFQDLNGQRLADVIRELMEKALLWKSAIAREEMPPYQSGRSGTQAENLFGLR